MTWRHCFFFFNDPATTEIYTLSLHDALPILVAAACKERSVNFWTGRSQPSADGICGKIPAEVTAGAGNAVSRRRSEEHTSELQSQSNLVCRLLPAKKNYCCSALK